jgi:hypothetical protein
LALLLAALATAGARAARAADTAHGASAVQARRAISPITVDGRLDEPAWEVAAPVSGFLQRDPDEGRSATEPTELRVLYDEAAVYVGVHLRDSEPARIVRQLSRRDAAAEADSFSLFLDPHHDHLTGVEFQVSAAGVQRDAAIYDDNFSDDTWDAVWDSAVASDGEGWTVEMRIPLSQLRFPRRAAHTWGLNARRLIQRKNEESWLALVPKNESGLASRMAHLSGLEGLAPSRHLELLPYATARAEYLAPAPGDPFNDGARAFAGAGLDLKYGLATNATLLAAVNPDFGQVEVDPAVVNLTAFETFFEEKRPFFTEGSQVFGHFARSGASEYRSFFYPEPQLFYSRRIGRAPQGRGTGVFVQTPAATTILGAAKLAGRTRGGWTFGALEALTGREYAQLSDGLRRERAEVEPLTNYFVGRARRELGRGAIGLIGTSVLRELRDPALGALLPGQAWLGGVDGHLYLDRRRDWVVSGGLAASRVSGAAAAITRLQRAAQRYYQRPDAPHVELDPLATSLSGWSGSASVNKNSGNLTANAGIWGISPGFEPNDAGFATQTDRGGAHALVQLRKLTPDGFTRTRQVWVSKWWTFNFGRESQGDGVQAEASLQFRNYWRFNLSLGRSWATLDDKLTRGGPTTIRPGIRSYNASFVTDSRRTLWLSGYATHVERDFDNWNRSLGLTLNYKPFPALTLSASPVLNRVHAAAQYLSTVQDAAATATFGARYVFGVLDQREVSMPMRVNLVLSPRLSLQLYAQALLSTGDYGAIRELAAPRTYDFLAYGTDLGALARDPSGAYLIDPDAAGPAAPFRVPDPAFNLKSLRANLVARWEFRPGSTLYLVWTQRREDLADPGDFSFGRDVSALFAAPGDDVLMLKIAWWLGR